MISRKSIYAFMLGALILTSCGNSNNLPYEIEYFPVRESSKGNWGMMNAKGEMLFADEFENEPSAVVNGYFSVREGNNSYALYEASKKPKVVKGMDDLFSVGAMNDGLIPICRHDERISIVDKKGKVKTVLKPIGGKEITRCYPLIVDDKIVARNDEGKWGVLNTKGQKVIDFKYDGMGPWFSEGLIIAVVEDDSGDERYYLLDKKGEKKATLKNGLDIRSSYFSYGYMVAKDSEGRWGLVNTKGEFQKLPAKVSRVKDFNKKYLIFGDEDGKEGVMEMGEDHSVIVKAKYESVNFIDHNTFSAYDSEEKVCIIFDKKGEKQEELDDYKWITRNNGVGCLIAYDGKDYQLLTSKYKTLGDSFHDIGMDISVSRMVYSDYEGNDD